MTRRATVEVFELTSTLDDDDDDNNNNKGKVVPVLN
jgi:hypothetical protein